MLKIRRINESLEIRGEKSFIQKSDGQKAFLKNSDDKNSDSKELLRINLIPKISTAESLKVKNPATTFSPTQGKTANSLVAKSLKMKNPTAKSLKMKKSVRKKPIDKICNKEKLQRNCKSFKSKSKVSNSNKTNEEKSDS